MKIGRCRRVGRLGRVSYRLWVGAFNCGGWFVGFSVGHQADFNMRKSSLASIGWWTRVGVLVWSIDI